jgi:hypothetical protein
LRDTIVGYAGIGQDTNHVGYVARCLLDTDFGKTSTFSGLAMDYRVGTGLAAGTDILHPAGVRNVARSA